MVGGIRSESVDEDVAVRKDHEELMISSKSLERLRSIPGRTPPEALDIGNLTRSRRLAFGLARMSVIASSISDVKVRPSPAACFLARFSRSSFILTVVLMHQSISIMHQYVNLTLLNKDESYHERRQDL